MTTICIVRDCGRARYVSDGYCVVHYKHLKKYGQLDLPAKLTAEEKKRRHKESDKRWEANNPIRNRFGSAKSHAKRRKLEWSLSFEEFSILAQMPCHYCSNKLGAIPCQSAGLDRLDCSRGYELGNVVPCCWPCNTIRSNILSPEETKSVINLLLRIREGDIK